MTEGSGQFSPDEAEFFSKEQLCPLIETKITIITVPSADSTTNVVYIHRDGREGMFPHDPTLWDKDCVYFSREWSKDPGLDDYDYDEEDTIVVWSAGRGRLVEGARVPARRRAQRPVCRNDPDPDGRTGKRVPGEVDLRWRYHV
jgi:hypothetical protein